MVADAHREFGIATLRRHGCCEARRASVHVVTKKVLQPFSYRPRLATEVFRQSPEERLRDELRLQKTMWQRTGGVDRPASRKCERLAALFGEVRRLVALEPAGYAARGLVVLWMHPQAVGHGMSPVHLLNSTCSTIPPLFR